MRARLRKKLAKKRHAILLAEIKTIGEPFVYRFNRIERVFDVRDFYRNAPITRILEQPS